MNSVERVVEYEKHDEEAPPGEGGCADHVIYLDCGNLSSRSERLDTLTT